MKHPRFRGLTVLSLAAVIAGSALGVAWWSSDSAESARAADPAFGPTRAWLAGVPGSSASADVTRRLRSASAAAYAPLTPPRFAVLAAAKLGSSPVELLGFKAHQSLCLVLLAEMGPVRPHCVSLESLRRLPTHAVPVALGRRATLNNVATHVMFGFADDRVQQMLVEFENGSRKTLQIRNNVFFALTTAEPVSLSSVSAGREHPVPLYPGDLASTAPLSALVDPRPEDLPGPSAVSASLPASTIAVIDRPEARGAPFHLADQALRGLGAVRTARMLRPNPKTTTALGVVSIGSVVSAGSGPKRGRQVCWVIAEALARGNVSSSCALRSSMFASQPFVMSEAVREGSWFRTVAGLAVDEVARLTVFRLDGRQFNVKVKDNAFVIQLAEVEFPVKIVAFDSSDAVIGLKLIQ